MRLRTHPDAIINPYHLQLRAEATEIVNELEQMPMYVQVFFQKYMHIRVILNIN